MASARGRVDDGARDVRCYLSYVDFDRIFGTRKWIIFIGSSICVVALVGLALVEQITFGIAVSLFCILGFFGMSYP